MRISTYITLSAALLVSGLAHSAAAEPLSIDEAMELAASNTEAAAMLELDVAGAEAGVDTALGAVLPTLSLNANATRNQSGLVAGDGASLNPWSNSLTGTASLDIFSARAIPSWMASRDTRDAAEAQASWDAAGLRLAAARAYYAALTARQNLAAAHDAVDARRASFEQTEVLLEAGYAIEADVARARLTVLQAESTAVEAEAALEGALDSLRFVTARDDIVAADLMEGNALGRGETTELESRPDLLARELAIDAQELSLLGERLTFLPTLSITGRYTLREGDVRSPSGLTGTVSLNASWTIFDFSRYGRIDSAEVRRDRLELQRDEAVRREEMSLASAARNLESARRRITIAEEALEVARQTQALVGERFAAGDVTSLEMTQADEAVFSAEIDRNIAQLQADLAALELEYLQGRLVR